MSYYFWLGAEAEAADWRRYLYQNLSDQQQAFNNASYQGYQSYQGVQACNLRGQL